MKFRIFLLTSVSFSALALAGCQTLADKEYEICETPDCAEPVPVIVE